MRSFIINNY